MARLSTRQVAALSARKGGALPGVPKTQSQPDFAGVGPPRMPQPRIVEPASSLEIKEMPAAPMRNNLPMRGIRAGARDGLGGGKGGFALHSSMGPADFMGRDVAHSSKLR